MSGGFSAITTIIGLLGATLTFVRDENRDAFFAFVDTTPKLIALFASVLILILLWVLACYNFGRWLVAKGKRIRPNIVFASFDVAQIQEEWVNQNPLRHIFASLKVINKEDVELKIAMLSSRGDTMPVYLKKNLLDFGFKILERK